MKEFVLSNGVKIPAVGFGTWQIPDGCAAKSAVRMAISLGYTHIDGAAAYDNEKSVGEGIRLSGISREQLFVTSKLWNSERGYESAKKALDKTLQDLGLDYLDYYLLHALQAGNYKTYDKYHPWDFVKEQKAKGLIKHWGFSFHATPDILDEILTAHPDAEFVQLQLNYADWENPDVTARENYEVARKHGKSIIVMEPVKGGALANPPAAVQEILREADPEASFASWAIRYAASLEGIITVLSGMSNIPQMRDNLSYMKEFKPLDAGEQIAVRKAQEAMNGIKSIPCTVCHYCTAGCPKNFRKKKGTGQNQKEKISAKQAEGHYPEAFFYCLNQAGCHRISVYYSG